jgi:hypothetical protein
MVGPTLIVMLVALGVPAYAQEEPDTADVYSAPDDEGSSEFIRTIAIEDATFLEERGEIEFCETVAAVDDDGEPTDELVTECVLAAGAQVDWLYDAEIDEEFEIPDEEFDEVAAPSEIPAGSGGLASGVPVGVLLAMLIGVTLASGGLLAARRR